MSTDSQHRRKAMTACTVAFTFILLWSGCRWVSAQDAAIGAPEALDSGKIATEIAEALWRHDLDAWFPRCVDHTHGGFTASFTSDWSPSPDQTKGVVFQSRMTWVAAEVVRLRPQHADRFRPYALHGLDFLERVLWDHERGGLFWERSPDGQAIPSDRDEKHVYGIAFAIYAASNVAAATNNQHGLDLAQRSFRWLEEHAHDPVNGGYFEALTRDGTPILEATPEHPRDRIGTRYGFKSMNSHLHLLEAFTALYGVWPDALVRQRSEEVFRIVRDQMAVEPGCLHQFFTLTFRPVPDLHSYGHDVETAFLLLEAAKGLGMPDDPDTWRVARQLVDHALDNGFDWERGGFYDRGSALYPATDTRKIWWAQAEGLNAVHLMGSRFAGETDRYQRAFDLTWRFIQSHQLDHDNGGWREELAADGAVAEGKTAKGHNWKAAYHTGRALMHISDRMAEHDE